jgi:catalase
MEAAIKQGKTVFHIQHLFSRRRIGMQIQIALSLFAANFVAWAAAWLAERLVASQGQGASGFASVKRAVRSAANAPALVEGSGGQVVVRFSPCSSWAGVVVALRGPRAVQVELPRWAAWGWGSSG